MVSVQLTRLDVWVGTIDTVECHHNTGATLLCSLQEADEEALGRTFLGIGVRHKAIGKDIILGGRELLDSTIAAMMIGEYQSIGTYHNARAEVAKVHHRILQAHAIGVIEFVRCKLQSQSLHSLSRLGIYSVQHPHAFVCFCVVNAKNKTQNSNKKSNFIHNLYF